MRTFLFISIFSIVSMITTVASAQAPSPMEVKKVLDYYYQGQTQPPILVDLKLCESIFKEGDEKNNCENVIDVNSITNGTSANIWMNFLVPKDTTASILIQLNQKGITRATRNTSISGSFRYRTWKKVTFNRTGDWTLKVFYENEDDVQELYSATLNVKEAPAAEESTGETTE